jgi:hypothetical protein
MNSQPTTNGAKEAIRLMGNLCESESTLAQIEIIADLISDCSDGGGKVLICGNGGSGCDAQHFAEEFTGRFAPTGETESERTFNSAVAARCALMKRGIHPETINVFTLGPHARRTRLVYAKVYAQAAQVGVIAWIPSNYKAEPWWRSKVRTQCFLKEIVGYPFEVLLNGGRISNSPG